MKSYSADIRERVIYYRQRGESAQWISKTLRLSKRSVERYWQRYVNEGSSEPRRRGGYKQSLLKPFFSEIKNWVKVEPCITLSEMSQRCWKEFGVEIKSTALWQQLDKMGLSFKKNAARSGARQGRRKVKA